ncbi:hypothetical protein HMPREF1992_00694 [Selenomonas sp. oral taxon 892 str. F0426]|nr:hypothetical protein HMPREF1992_00694 [Selenomonas sp. oral taxon 892 str. F0426]
MPNTADFFSFFFIQSVSLSYIDHKYGYTFMETMSEFIHPHFVSSNAIGKSGENRLIVTVATKQKAFLLACKKAYKIKISSRLPVSRRDDTTFQ